MTTTSANNDDDDDDDNNETPRENREKRASFKQQIAFRCASQSRGLSFLRLLLLPRLFLL
jgi:hypothetical protein